jgi:hypothetical protein
VEEKGRPQLEKYADKSDGARVRPMCRGDILPVRMNSIVRWKSERTGCVNVEKKKLKSMFYSNARCTEKQEVKCGKIGEELEVKRTNWKVSWVL